MADELPPGSMNLEDDEPSADATVPVTDMGVVSPAPAVPVQAAPAPSSEEPAPTDQDVQEAGGDQRVAGLIAALRIERQKARTATERASRVDALEQELAQNRPYVEFVKANPNLLQPRQPEPPPVPPAADPDAVEVAQLMDFYKSDGSLDVEKGAKHLALMDRRAGRQSQEAVKPYREQSLQERSDANFQRALNVRDAEGNLPSQEAVRSVWNLMPVEDRAKPETAMVMAMLAHGADKLRMKVPIAAPQSAPVVTESAGGQSRPLVSLSALEERILSQRGTSAQAWAEHTKTFQPGRPTVLEDD